MAWSISSGKQVVLADGVVLHFARQTSLKLDSTWKSLNRTFQVVAYASTPLFPKADFRQYDLLIDGVSWNDLPTLNKISPDCNRQTLPNLASPSAHQATSNSLDDTSKTSCPTPSSTSSSGMFRRSVSMPDFSDAQVDGIFKSESFTPSASPTSVMVDPNTTTSNPTIRKKKSFGSLSGLTGFSSPHKRRSKTSDSRSVSYFPVQSPSKWDDSQSVATYHVGSSSGSRRRKEMTDSQSVGTNFTKRTSTTSSSHSSSIRRSDSVPNLQPIPDTWDTLPTIFTSSVSDHHHNMGQSMLRVESVPCLASTPENLASRPLSSSPVSSLNHTLKPTMSRSGSVPSFGFGVANHLTPQHYTSLSKPNPAMPRVESVPELHSHAFFAPIPESTPIHFHQKVFFPESSSPVSIGEGIGLEF